MSTTKLEIRHPTRSTTRPRRPDTPRTLWRLCLRQYHRPGSSALLRSPMCPCSPTHFPFTIFCYYPDDRLPNSIGNGPRQRKAFHMTAKARAILYRYTYLPINSRLCIPIYNKYAEYIMRAIALICHGYSGSICYPRS